MLFPGGKARSAVSYFHGGSGIKKNRGATGKGDYRQYQPLLMGSPLSSVSAAGEPQGAALSALGTSLLLIISIFSLPCDYFKLGAL